MVAAESVVHIVPEGDLSIRWFSLERDVTERGLTYAKNPVRPWRSGTSDEV